MWACLPAAFWERSLHSSPREQQRSSLTCIGVCRKNEKSFVYMSSSLLLISGKSLSSGGVGVWGGGVLDLPLPLQNSYSVNKLT